MREINSPSAPKGGKGDLQACPPMRLLQEMWVSPKNASNMVLLEAINGKNACPFKQLPLRRSATTGWLIFQH